MEDELARGRHPLEAGWALKGAEVRDLRLPLTPITEERRREMEENEERQLASEKDRSTLREYLNRRLDALRQREASNSEEAAFVEGAELEIIFIYDELLGEQAPESAQKALPGL